MDDFKKSMDEWINSPAYKRINEALERRRNIIIDLTLQQKKLLMEQKRTYYITDDELEVICDNIIAFELLSELEKEEYEWASEILSGKLTKKELIFDYIKNLSSWYFHLKNMIKKENYELASKIKKVIEIEINEFKITLMNKYSDYDDEDSALIDEINNEVKFQFEV